MPPTNHGSSIAIPGTACYDKRMNKLFFPIAVFFRGCLAVIAQTLLIQELLILFFGNELTFSLILGIWLVSGASGSLWAASLYSRIKNPVGFFSAGQLLCGLWLTVAIILVRSGRVLLHIPTGEVLPLGHIVLIIFGGIFLSSFLDGLLFTVAFRTLKSMARLYFLESSGSLLAGLVFSFLLLKIFTPLQTSLSLGMICVFLSGVLFLQQNRKWPARVCVLIFLAMGVALTSAQALEHGSRSLEWRGTTLLYDKNSLYGNIALTRQAEQATIFYNGLPVIALPQGEGYFTQDFVHLGMLTAARPRRVLFIGNAAGGILAEAEKYPLTCLTYAELDPDMIRLLKKLPYPSVQKELKDPRLKIVFTDGRNFLKTTRERFDVIFVNTGTPTSLSLNRYATREFFDEANRCLERDGLLVFKAAGSLAYVSPEMARVNASLWKTASRVFPVIRVIPGDGYNIFLASRRPVSADPEKMTRRIKEWGITASLLNSGYIRSRLNPSYEQWFTESIRPALPRVHINQDLKPSGLFDGLSLYYSQFSKKIPRLFEGFRQGPGLFIFPVVLVFMLTWALRLRKTRNILQVMDFTIFSSGFFGMGIQLCVLFLFQSFLGYIFQWLAVLTAAFMAGGSLGSIGFLRNRGIFSSQEGIRRLDLQIPALAAGLVFLVILTAGSPLSAIMSGWVFALVSVSAGALTGMQMPAIQEFLQKNAKEERAQKIAGRIYGLDLLGACLACLLVPLILIPGLGIGGTIFLLWLLKTVNAAFYL